MSHSHGGMDGMSGMGGMDGASVGLFVVDNKRIARVLWYLVAATAAARGCRALLDYLRTVFAKRKHSLRSAVPSRPSTTMMQVYDTFIASCREVSYPAPRPFQGRIVRSFTPPKLGQSLLILAYWSIILIMLWTNVLLGPTSSLYGYRWEKPAFRAGWVSIAQVPHLYALSCKFNIISIITGISYERLNWMHRWVSRTLFLTVIVHWAYFFHEWTLADFVKYQFSIMPMVKYGFGAWAVIGWSVLTGFGFFRDLCYEIWLLQHLASAGVLLWLLWVHVPVYARYNIWMAIAFVAFDRGVRGLWSLWNNLHMRALGKGGIGFHGEVKSLQDGYMKLTLRNVDFSWRAGQHVFLSIPACGIFESHPFTIANLRPSDKTDRIAELEVFLKCHSGFTRRLRNQAEKAISKGRPKPSHRVLLSGPWGAPPLATVERSNTIIFIASSTGASYTVPLLEHAVKHAPFVQQLYFYWIVRHPSQIAWFDSRLRAAVNQLASLGLNNIIFKIFITGDCVSGLEDIRIPAETVSKIGSCWLRKAGLPYESAKPSEKSPMSAADAESVGKDVSEKDTLISTRPINTSTSSSSSESEILCCGCKGCKCKLAFESPSFTYALGRPCSFDVLIRPAVETANGETSIIACGGQDLMAQIGTYVGALSDERAVHKGTGAQGIHLWTESYGW